MALTDPAAYRDHTEDWMRFWNERRQAALRAIVTPELVAEHRADCIGATKHHSENLRKVLNYVRMAPTLGKDFLHPSVPFREYRIGVISPRNTEVVFPDLPRFTTTEEAAHAVFLRRLRAIGVDVDGIEAPR